jgi:hypothetical protein
MCDTYSASSKSASQMPGLSPFENLEWFTYSQWHYQPLWPPNARQNQLFSFFLLLYVELAPSSANEASRAWEPRLTRLVTSSSKNTFGNVESVAFRVNKLTEIDMGNQLW